ncbi:cytidine deaminase [Vibrio aquimaris]|uniref:Flagellar sheath adhesin n=1 Tax=Vibrio aquimaris TaxID=2587862 RepID=A0A5P9CHD0_9VIBR|nr:cytidine deaminase [Vibrio aquimaris]QFT25680.1 hypothetical protein FIV01_04490 [Vibrio aquimaris]
MKNIKLFTAILSLAVLSGCASRIVEMPDNYWEKESVETVVVAFVKQPQMSASRSGAQGLLDMAINEAITDSVENHIETLNYETLEGHQPRIAEILKAKGAKDVIVLQKYFDVSDANELPEAEQKEGYFNFDVSKLREKHNASHLLVIQVINAGTIRDYYGFIPLSDPRGYVNGEVTIVRLSDNKIQMRNPILVEIEVPEGIEWDDEENGYPAISKVVNSALDEAGHQVGNML